MFKPLKLGFANQNNRENGCHSSVLYSKATLRRAIKTIPAEDNCQNIGLPNKTRDKKNCYKQTHTHIPHYKNCHFDINSILSKKWYQHITIFWARLVWFCRRHMCCTYVLHVNDQRSAAQLCRVELSCAGSQATDLRAASAMWRPRFWMFPVLVFVGIPKFWIFFNSPTNQSVTYMDKPWDQRFAEIFLYWTYFHIYTKVCVPCV